MPRLAVSTSFLILALALSSTVSGAPTLDERRGRGGPSKSDRLSNVADASDVIANGVSIGTDIYNTQARDLEARRGKGGKSNSDRLSNAADASDLIANGVSIGTDIAYATQSRDVNDGDELDTRGLETRRRKGGKSKSDYLSNAADASDVIANGVSIGTDIAYATQARDLEARRKKGGKSKSDYLSNAADASDIIANGVDIGTDIAYTQSRSLEARRKKSGKSKSDYISNAADASDIIANGVSVGTDIAYATQTRDVDEIEGDEIEARGLEARRGKGGKSKSDYLSNAADASDIIANGVSIGTDIAGTQARGLEEA